jgi:hypothetical protein
LRPAYSDISQLASQDQVLWPEHIIGNKHLSETAALTAVNGEYSGWTQGSKSITDQKIAAPKGPPTPLSRISCLRA